MKIPKKVHFSGFTYKVKLVENLDGRSNWGRTNTDPDQTIFLEKKVTRNRQEQTFIHELMHVAWKHTFSEIDSDKEEKQIKAFAMNIYGILKDNKLLK